MSLFGKKKEKAKDCCCGGNRNAQGAKSPAKCDTQLNDSHLQTCPRVKVLGTGCAKCHALEANVKAALEMLGMDTVVEHVTDFAQIAAYGVMSTPALVVDGKVVAYGKVLSVEEVVSLLKM